MFNKKIYCEGIRQTYLFGVFLIAISTIINCFVPLNELIINTQMPFANSESINIDVINQNPDYSAEVKELLIAQMRENYANYSIYSHMDIEQANTTMNVLMFIIPLIMIFAQFNFLGSRKASDFYHSVPISRLSLVVNFSLSAMTWIFLCMVIPMLANGALMTIVDGITLNYSLLLPNIIDKVIISFLIYSALLIGMSLTGQILNAGVVAGLILYLPRFVTFVTLFVVSDITNALSRSYGYYSYTGMFGNNLNLLFNKIIGPYISQFSGVAFMYDFVQTTENFEVYDYNINAYIYTLTIALFLFALGCYAFVKRTSESAGKNAVNKFVHHAIRITLVSPIVIFVAGSIKADGYFLDYIFPVTGALLFIYFVYELISTRNLKSVGNSAKFLPVLLVIGFAYSGVLELIVLNTFSKIDANSINSVRFDFNAKYGVDEIANEHFDSYTSKLIAEYDFNDPVLIQTVSEALAKNIDYKSGASDEFRVTGNYTQLIEGVDIKTGFKNVSRLLEFNFEETEIIKDIVYNNDYVNSALMQLPEKTEVVAGRATSLTKYNYSHQEIQSIIDVLYDEYNSLTNEQKQQVLFSYDLYDNNFYYSSAGIELARKEYGFGYYKEGIHLTDNDSESYIEEATNYNSDNLPIILALYTDDGYSKYIQINNLLPNTKKLIIDMFIQSNTLSYDVLEYITDLGTPSDYIFTNFNIASFDDKFNIKTLLYYRYGEYVRDLSFDKPAKELLDLFKTASLRLQTEVDYDNMYIVTFETITEGYNFTPIRVLLPFTQQEYETIILNIAEYSDLYNDKNEIIK